MLSKEGQHRKALEIRRAALEMHRKASKSLTMMLGLQISEINRELEGLPRKAAGRQKGYSPKLGRKKTAEEIAQQDLAARPKYKQEALQEIRKPGKQIDWDKIKRFASGRPRN